MTAYMPVFLVRDLLHCAQLTRVDTAAGSPDLRSMRSFSSQELRSSGRRGKDFAREPYSARPVVAQWGQGPEIQTALNGCSTVVLVGFTCPAMTVVTVVLRALVRVRERALGCFARSPKSPPARRHVVSPTCHRVP